MRMMATMLALLLAGAAAMAHGDYDHVRGTVTQVSPQALTVQTTGKTTKTLVLSGKTVFERAGKKASLADLKVGDRVVVDVPKNSSEAHMVQFGAAAKASATTTAHAHENK